MSKALFEAYFCVLGKFGLKAALTVRKKGETMSKKTQKVGVASLFILMEAVGRVYELFQVPGSY